MFKNLTDFSYKRTNKEAFGFYLAYFLLLVLIGFLIGAVIGIVSTENAFQLGLRAGQVFAIIFTVGLSFMVLSKKKLLNKFGYILLALLAGVLAIFGGALLGLIPVAYLTKK